MTLSARSELERLRLSVGALQSQNATFRELVAIHDRLGGLVLQGADVAAITQVLAELIGRRVLLLDAQLQVVSMAPANGLETDPAWAPEEPYVTRVLASLAGERRPLRVPGMPDWGVAAACVLAPVAVGEALLGYLALLEETPPGRSENIDLQIVQHAAAVYALSLMRERLADEVAQQLKDELFEGLLLGRAQDEQVVLQRALRLGYDPTVAYRAVVLALAPSVTARPDLANRRRRGLERLATTCTAGMVTVREDELVVLAPDPGAFDLAHSLRQQASAVLPAADATIGIGGVCASPQAIPRSYEQARRAISTAVRFGKQGEVVGLEDLGVYRLLFHVTDRAELRGFVDQVLGSLIEYDRQHQASLVATLATFLATNGNLQASARQLDLHVNSVSYRLQRVQAIAGLDLDQAEDRLLAHLAIKILDSGVDGAA